VTWGPRLVQVFAPDERQFLVTSEGDGAVFGEWSPFDVGLRTSEKPAAVAWNDGGSSGKNLRVFVVGDDHQVHSNGYDDETAGWYGWSDLPSNFYGFENGPGATSRGINRIDVFGRASGDALNSLEWISSEQDGYGEWEFPPDPGLVRYAPAAVASDRQQTSVDRFDVFAVFTDGTLHYITYGPTDVQQWGTWQEVPAPTKFTGGPAVTSWRPGQFDVFVRDDVSHHLMHSRYDGTAWSAWDEMTEFEISEAPAATSWGDDRIDVFVIDNERRMLHRWHENGDWHSLTP